eukprot:TRINITY_DN52392_c0_g1_i2.p1 TRINITY_DN52392_c0_g1~~TRINITY_DN52392_c0_g1_i2.p1  ORF type:complete len:340 (+),score=81.60 TRINITY_DN52392_c0_g1_i2:200-1219(+)
MAGSMPELSHIRAAAARIASHGGITTPILSSQLINQRAQMNVALKCEHLQATGSFKFRGATNAVWSLDKEDAGRGVVAHSSGNHGAALAAAAQARGVPCTVVVPDNTPSSKVDNMRSYGAEVVLCPPTQEARAAVSEREANRMGGATMVHPYNDPAVIAGQGTIAVELLQQLPELDAILVPTSGGGMLGGIAIAAKALNPAVKVLACEPAGKRLQDSLAAGVRVVDPDTANLPIDTIADAIRTQPLGERGWQIAQAHVEQTVVAVDDAQIREAMWLLAQEFKQVVEPAGGVALAAVLSPEFKQYKEQVLSEQGIALDNVAVVVCGGNVDLQTFAQLISQ